MAIADCVRALICPLGNAVISAIRGLIDLFIIEIDAQILAARALLLQLDIPAQAAEAGLGLTQTVMNEARSAANFIPVALTTQCVDLGQFGIDIRRSIEDKIADLANFKRELVLMLSFRDELDALILELEKVKQRYQDFASELTLC